MEQGDGRRMQRPWLRWLRRLAALSAALAFLMVVVGAAFQARASASDRKRYPPAGTLVEVGDRRLHLHCVGEGSPTVIFEAGAGGGVLDWTLVQAAVGEFTRACAYDRAGLGWSDPVDRPRRSPQVAEELHTLLNNAQVDGPLVLVGHSLGGIYVRSFADRWPHRVAGMVLLESAHENQATRMPPEVAESQEGLMRFLAICRIVAPLGIIRIADVAGGYTVGLPFNEDQRKAVIAVMNRSGYCAGLANEWHGWPLQRQI